MHTEASHRFERGADIAATVPSINRTATLIQEVAGGEILRGVVDAFPKPYRRPAVALRRARILQVMGTEIEDSFTESILTDLNFEIVSRDQTGWQVQLPTSRLDVEREIDLIEEIARHYGYNRFASRLPAWCGGATRRPQAIQERTVKQRLLSLGYSETLTYSFVDASENQRFSTLEPIRLRNPLSTETEVMRTSLVPGLLSSFLRNYNRGTKTVRIFEMGRIYPSSGLAAGDDRMSPAPTDDQLENLFLGMILSGQAQEKTVHADSRPVNFFDLKGDLEALLESLSLPLHGVAWQPATSGRLPGYFHPAVCASMHLEEKLLGVFGQLHPRICESYKIKQPVFLAEIPLACWYLHEVKERAVEDLAKYPAVERDLSIVVDSSVDYHSILLAVQEAGILEVRECFPFDLYCGGKLPAGKKSISISLVYQALDRTLVEEEVNDYHGRILDLLQKKLGAQLRA
jgi:phenylalanyl-tRNA synthetase beta chain